MTENGHFPNGDDIQNDMKDDTGEFDADALQKLRDAVENLPREVMPSNDAWPTIRARIESTRVRELNTGKGTNGRTHGMRSWPVRSAIAATALLAIGGYAALRASHKPDSTVTVAQPTQPVASVPGVIKVDSTPQPPTVATTVDAGREMTAVLARYAVAANDLETDFKSRRDRIDPETVAVLDSCIRTIDSAIAESQSALKAKPDNATVAELLTATYQQKLDLLRRAAELPLRSL